MKMNNRCENVYLKIKVWNGEVDLIIRSGISQRTDLRGVQSFKQMNKQCIFFCCWRSNMLGECWSSVTTGPKPAEVQMITMTLCSISLQFTRNAYICLYRPTSFRFLFIADMPGYLMSAKMDMHCVLQVYSDNTYNSTKALLLYCTVQTENHRDIQLPYTSWSGSSLNWSDEYEEEKDAITVTTGAQISYLQWPKYL